MLLGLGWKRNQCLNLSEQLFRSLRQCGSAPRIGQVTDNSTNSSAKLSPTGLDRDWLGKLTRFHFVLGRTLLGYGSRINSKLGRLA
jgi:hypothetical protein